MIKFQRTLAKKVHPNIMLYDVEEAMVDISYQPKIGKIVRKAISETIWRASILQTLQGICTAGPVRSIRYGLEKLKKKASGSTEQVLAPILSPGTTDPTKIKKPIITPTEIGEMESLQRQKLQELQRAQTQAREEAAGAQARAEQILVETTPVTLRDLDLPPDPLPGLVPPSNSPPNYSQKVTNNSTVDGKSLPASPPSIQQRTQPVPSSKAK